MVRFSKIILSLLILSFSFQAQAKNPPPGSGTSDIPANILIMLDTSGSMNDKLYSSVQVYYPLDVATDSSGNVYVMEYYNKRIKVFDSSGTYLRSFGSWGYGCNQWRYARRGNGADHQPDDLCLQRKKRTRPSYPRKLYAAHRVRMDH